VLGEGKRGSGAAGRHPSFRVATMLMVSAGACPGLPTCPVRGDNLSILPVPPPVPELYCIRILRHGWRPGYYVMERSNENRHRLRHCDRATKRVPSTFTMHHHPSAHNGQNSRESNRTTLPRPERTIRAYLRTRLVLLSRRSRLRSAASASTSRMSASMSLVCGVIQRFRGAGARE
jgi:hypothetical protein